MSVQVRIGQFCVTLVLIFPFIQFPEHGIAPVFGLWCVRYNQYCFPCFLTPTWNQLVRSSWSLGCSDINKVDNAQLYLSISSDLKDALETKVLKLDLSAVPHSSLNSGLEAMSHDFLNGGRIKTLPLSLVGLQILMRRERGYFRLSPSLGRLIQPGSYVSSVTCG